MPPTPHLLPPEPNAPIGDSPGKNASLAMLVRQLLHPLRLPFMAFLPRSFSLLACLSDALRDSSCFPLSLLSQTASLRHLFYIHCCLFILPGASSLPFLPSSEPVREPHVARLVATHCVSRGIYVVIVLRRARRQRD